MFSSERYNFLGSTKGLYGQRVEDYIPKAKILNELNLNSRIIEKFTGMETNYGYIPIFSIQELDTRRRI